MPLIFLRRFSNAYLIFIDKVKFHHQVTKKTVKPLAKNIYKSPHHTSQNQKFTKNLICLFSPMISQAKMEGRDDFGRGFATLSAKTQKILTSLGNALFTLSWKQPIGSI